MSQHIRFFLYMCLFITNIPGVVHIQATKYTTKPVLFTNNYLYLHLLSFITIRLILETPNYQRDSETEGKKPNWRLRVVSGSCTSKELQSMFGHTTRRWGSLAQDVMHGFIGRCKKARKAEKNTAHRHQGSK